MKKLNKFFAILVSLAMMATLCVCMAFATNPATSTNAGEGVATKIVKAIDKPAGLSGLPSNTQYNFTVANTTLGNKTVTLTDNTKLTSDDILAAYLSDITAAGKYTFTVTENVPAAAEGQTVADNVVTKTIDADDFTVTETYTYSKAVYQVEAIIASDTAADGTVSYYVQQSAVKMTVNDAGQTQDPAVKPEGGDDEGAVSFTFTNKYNKKITNKDQEETTETEDATTLKIKKTTSLKEGEEGTIPDQEFKFRATVTFPANSTETQYTATVKDANGPVAGASAVTFTDGQPTIFTLKAGQYLSFDNIEVGAVVTSLTEDSYPGFTATGTINNGTTPITDAAAGNAITVNNEYDPSAGSITGILMSNIPYIVLALVAIGGLCAYVVVRRRNEDNA